MSDTIKATELRLGNIVSLLFGTIGAVTKLHAQKASDGTFYLIEVDNKETFIPQHVKGILLTPELLLQAGFEQSQSSDDEERTIYSIQVANNTALYFDRHKDWMRNDQEVEWYLSHEWNNNHFKNDFWSKPKYLHELQNIYFALTGEELLIAL